MADTTMPEERDSGLGQRAVERGLLTRARLAGGSSLAARSRRLRTVADGLARARAAQREGETRGARAACQGVLACDGTNAEAEAGLRWVEIEEQRRTEAARRAQDEAAAQTMRKVGLVNDVVFRWARRLAGFEAEGLGWMQESERLDPDLPFGPLMEALVCFSRYLEFLPLPASSTGPEGLRLGTLPAESEAERRLRERGRDVLVRAARSGAWLEQVARDFRRPIDALQALQARKYPEAEAGLTGVLDSGSMLVFRTVLLFARAKVRYLLKRFPDAIEDMNKVIEVRARQAEAHACLGRIQWGLGLEQETVGADPRTAFEKGIESFTTALRLGSPDRVALSDRGTVRRWLGEAQARYGADPGTAYREAIADLTRVLDLDERDTISRNSRANVYAAIGDAEADRGADPRAWYEKAVADLDAVLRLSPRFGIAYSNRSWVHVKLAQQDLRQGVDPRPRLRAALADGEEFLRQFPGYFEAFSCRGNAYLSLGDAEATLKLDPTGSWEKARADLDAVVQTGVASWWHLQVRGQVLERLGQCAAAATDYETALKMSPGRGRAELEARLQAARTRATGGAWVATLDRAARAIGRGDYAGARPLYEEVLRAATTAPSAGAALSRLLGAAHYNLACIYALLSAGRSAPDATPAPPAADEAARLRDLAFEHLDSARALGFDDPAHLAHDPDLAPLHDDARWAKLLEGRR